MGDQEAMTMADGVGDGEGIAAADSEPALWVAEFNARLEALERAWRRRRWWGWVRMGVGNWVVADLSVTLFSVPLMVTMFSSWGPPALPLHDLVGGLLGLSWLMVLYMPVSLSVWVLALALSYANVRVHHAIAARRRG